MTLHWRANAARVVPRAKCEALDCWDLKAKLKTRIGKEEKVLPRQKLQ